MRLPSPSRGALVMVASIALAQAGGLASTEARAQEGSVLVISGKGFGHGVGMPQDGALAMGKKGASTPDILNRFYPGTTTGTSKGNVRVLLLVTATREVTLTFPEGGTVAGDSTIKVGAGESIRLGWANGSYWAEEPASGSSTTTTTEPGAEETTTTTGFGPVIEPPTELGQEEETTTTTTTTTAPPEQPTTTVPRTTSSAPWRASSDASVGVGQLGRRYRGVLDVRLDAQQSLRVVNQVDVETYLKGMGEVRNPSWPPASLRAQAVAARTYAMRAMAAGGEICPDQRCQVYLGAQAEYAAMNKAVNDTAGQVLMSGGSLASTVYSANGGGHTATREEGFGTSSAGYPYLVAMPYETNDPISWSLKVSFADIASLLSYSGQLTNVTISKTGPSKRALEVRLEGTTGTQAVSGRTFDARLGLKSTLFTFAIEQGTAPTLPAPTPGLQQVVPEDVAALPPLVFPPRPVDPPLPASLLRPSTTSGPAATVAAPAVPAAARERSNVGWALFVIATLGLAGGAAALIRRSS